MDEKTLNKISESIEASLTKHVEALKKTIDEQVEKRLQELGLKDVKKPEFKGTEDNSVEQKQKAVTFLKALYNKDSAQLKAISEKGMTEGTGSAGGYLVPQEFAAEINRIELDYGLVRKFCYVKKMKNDILNVPTLATSVTVYWPGEATAGTASTPVLANIALTAKTLTGITVYSNELLEDADVIVVNELSDLFAEAFAGEEDKQGLVGTGSPFTGILSDSTVTVVTMASGQDTFPELTLNDLRDLIANVKSSVLPTSAFIMHRLVWNMVQKLTQNSQNVSSFQNPIAPFGSPSNSGGSGDGFGLKPSGFLWGYPVYLNDQMPSTTAVSTKYVIFGSLKKGLYMGDRQQMTIKISEDGVVGGVSLLETNQAAIRLTERVALAVGLGAAFAVLKTAAS